MLVAIGLVYFVAACIAAVRFALWLSRRVQLERLEFAWPAGWRFFSVSMRLVIGIFAFNAVMIPLLMIARLTGTVLGLSS